MSITILRGRKLVEFPFDSIEDALANLQRHDKLVLSGEVIEEPIVIPVRNVTLFNDGPTVGVIVAAGVSKFYVGDGANVVVRTESSDTTVYGADAEALFVGGDTDDRYNGGAGDEVILGGGGDDQLYGGAGNDILVSETTGRTWLRADEGDDLLVARSGQTLMQGGTGADVFEVHVDADQHAILDDFSAQDRLEIVGYGAYGSLDELRAFGGRVFENGKGNAIITVGEARIELRGVSLAELEASDVVFTDAPRAVPTDPLAPPPPPPPPPPPTDPEPEPWPQPEPGVTTILVGDVEYHLRDAEPDHARFKIQDTAGNWYSPDYFVLVAGGQSNMVGSSKTGDYIMNGDVMAYDWFNDRVIQGDYGAFPATLNEGAAPRNNLYFPMAVELTEELQRPVLVVNRAYSGSRIDTWLESGEGSNWALLQDSVTKALAHVGQSSADAFIWHQGESDYPVPTDDFVLLLRELIEQVRAQGWAGPDLDILMGELSREGTNFAQNAALQVLEVEASDPNLGFVSSVGLSSDDRDGVHFNGPSLEEFGTRFAQALLDLQAGVVAGPNAAPQPIVAGKVGTLTVAEGQELSVDVSSYFTDADGDDLYYYSYLNRRSEVMTFEDQDANSIVLRPDYTSAGEYRVFVYATDGSLDGDKISFDLTVTDAAPLVTSYSGGDYTRELYSYRDFATAMADMTQNKALDVLDGAAFGTGATTLTVESLHIRGESTLRTDFVLGEGIARVSLYGQAGFDAQGNALDNRIIGNDAGNRLVGFAGTDQLYGGRGTDVLVGGSGDDRLYGEDGDDILQAGSGNDRVNGGRGADRFHFTGKQGDLTIEDYEAVDRIEVRNFAGITTYDQFIAAADRVFDNGGRAILDFGEQRLTLNDTATAELSEDMFVFV